MSRQAKKDKIKPSFKIEYFDFEYECPTCTNKVVRSFSMITPLRAHIQSVSSYWCSNGRCGAIHRVTYRLFKRRNGEPKIKIYAFTSNGKACVKRFKLLEPTTKGEK